jgi:hypothetical protein
MHKEMLVKTLLIAALVGVLGIGSAIGAPVKKHALHSHHATKALKAKALKHAAKAHHKAAKHKLALHSHRTAPLA